MQLTGAQYRHSNAVSFTIEWERYYDELNVSSDEAPIAALVDGAKNIYTTNSFRTVKVDSNGTLRWYRTWNAGYSFTQDRKLFSDGKGNIFVAGDAQIGPAQHLVGVALVKYDSAGTKLWDRTYTGLATTATRGGDGFCDSKGNAVLAGFVYRDLPDTVTYVLIKYSPAGEILWKLEYPAYNGNGYALACDAQDNIYLAGYLYDPSKKAGYGIVKFNAMGERQWFKSMPYAASDIIVDGSGNIYVTEVDWSQGPTVYAAKYSSLSALLWQNKVGAFSEYIITPVVDAAGSVFIASASVVSKFLANGTPAWKKSAPRSIESSSPLMGANGKLYYIGTSDLMMSDTAGNFQPIFTFSSTNQALLCLDSKDQAVILGSVEPNETRSVDIKIWKTAPDGTLRWSNTYDIEKVTSANWVKQMIVDENGNAVLTGGQDNLLLEYSAAGDLTMKTRFRTAFNYEEGNAVCAAPNNTIVIAAACRFECSSTVSKFKRNGDLLWRVYCTEDGAENYQPKYLAVDGYGNIVVAGETYDNNNFTDIITVKYDAEGNLLWRKRYDGLQHREDRVNELLIDKNGSIIVVGSTVMDPKFGSDVLILKYSGAGELEWKRNYEGEVREIDEGYSALLDPAGNIYVGGVTNLFVLGTRSDFLLTKYSAAGDSLWSYHTKHGDRVVNTLAKIVRLSDQSIVGVGSGYKVGAGGFGLVRIDSGGKSVWSQLHDSGFSAPMYTSWYVAANHYDEIGTVALVHNSYRQHDPVFSFRDKNGNHISSFRLYGPPGVAFDPMGLESTLDGGFLMAGNVTYGFEHVIYLIKVKRNENTSNGQPEQTIPASFALMQNFPNPFNPATRIQYQIPRSEFVTLKVYDMIGREVERLVQEVKAPGIYTVDWNASHQASGNYLVRMKSGEFTAVKKLQYIK
jgi:hypothetical protein